MRKKFLTITSIVLIIAITFIGAAYADRTNSVTSEISLNTDAKQTEVKDSKNNSDSIYSGNDMVNIMRENGFKDASEYMQAGDYEKMNEFMNNLTEEDYQRMIDIMEDNGYGSMAQMMQSIGREGMVRMHNSMDSIRSSSSGMMGGYGPVIK